MDIVVLKEFGRVPVTVFRIKGDIDVNSYEQLQAKAEEAIAGGVRYLLLDLSMVSYISSAGLRALHQIFTQLQAQAEDESNEALHKGLRDGSFKSRHLKLFNPTPTVQTVLKTAGFDMYLDIYKDLKDAVASF